MIAAKARDRLALFARNKMAAIVEEEKVSHDILLDLKESRGFTTQFLHKQRNRRNSNSPFAQVCLSFRSCTNATLPICYVTKIMTRLA
jgi:hypothetical protein